MAGHKKMADGGHRWMKVFAAGGEGGRNSAGDVGGKQAVEVFCVCVCGSGEG
ncbi:Uncharacterized protein APZ42_011089 [Daphnia magna]|uniref:Uncharacterized protein n=1 Tax=Daphnia magna TaxID=35525 RepID=A0A162T5V1_9CRUS|nr:Uncharacterized protein APZ42_011089 [Daphnia magna]